MEKYQMQANSPSQRVTSYLEYKAAFPEKIPDYISPKMIFLLNELICIGISFFTTKALPKRYTTCYPKIEALMKISLGYFIGKRVTNKIYDKSSSSIQTTSWNTLKNTLPQKKEAIYTVLNTISDEGSCCGICLCAAKLLREKPDLTLSLLEKTLTSKEQIINSLIFQKALGTNLIVRDGYNELIPFVSIASAFINTIAETLRKHHIHEICQIPKEEIECHNSHDLTFPKHLDKTRIYSLITSFDDKFLIINVALSLGESHAILFFSSKEKNRHFYIDPNEGLFSFDTKEEFSLEVAKLIEKNYTKIKLPTLNSFTVINSTKN